MNYSNLPYFFINKTQKERNDYSNWGFDKLKIDEIWDKGYQGEGVKIGILDTGYYHTSEISSDRITLKDFTGDGFGGETDEHGTQVAHIIGAEDNQIGYKGCCPKSNIFLAKVVNNKGKTKDEYLLNAIDWAIDNEIDVLNISLQYQWCSMPVHEKIVEAVDRNMKIVCAAGNKGGDLVQPRVYYPGAYQETIAIGAIDDQNEIPSFSSKGQLVDFVAPGVRIRTYSGTMKGTSASAPFITSIIALFLNKQLIEFPSQNLPDQYGVKKNLISNSNTSRILNPSFAGFGKINTKKMFNL